MARWPRRAAGGGRRRRSATGNETGDAAPVAPDPSGTSQGTLLEVRDLRIHFPTDDGLVKAVDGVTFSLDRGRTLGIVGESGSGKSVTSLGIMGLHQGVGARITGEIRLDGENLVAATPARVRQLRGSGKADSDDEFADVAQILRRRGIS
jgi:peptide/nickel transport system ATP-binding protein